MILWYSGTGNSRYAAAKIAEATNDELTSINDIVRSRITDPASAVYEFHSEEPYVVVTPTYCWQLPRLVEKFLRESRFTGSSQIYFIMTCGSETGNADIYLSKLCKDLELTFMGLAPVVMPENYIAMFDSPDYDESLTMIYAANQTLETLANYITFRKPFHACEHTSRDARLSSLNGMFYKLYVNDRKYRVTDKCTGCGTCSNVCPLANIRIVNSRPVWNGNCTQCMACISICPVNAIEYGSKSKGKRRYYLYPDGRQKL